MKRTHTLFFIFGTLSIGTQTLMIRSLVSVFSGSEIVIGFALGMWLIGTAVGGFLSRALVPLKEHGNAFSALSLTLFFCVPVSTLTALLSKRLFGFTPFEIVSAKFLLISSFISTFIPSLIFGIVFAVSVDYIREFEKKPIRIVYLWESIGSFAGGGLLSVIVIPNLNHISGAFIISAISLIPLYIFNSKHIKALSCVISLSLIFSGIALNEKFGLIMERLKTGEKVLQYTTGYNGDYSLLKKGDTYYIFLNNSPVLNYPEYKTREPNVYIPLAYNMKDVLIIGGSLSVERKLSPENWDVLIYPHFIVKMEEKIPGIKEDSERVIIEEPLLYLRKSVKEYDGIVVYHSDPYTGGDNRFFTKEFFNIVKKRLKDGGTFIFSAGEPSNYMTSEQAEYLASLMRTAKDVFPFVKIFPLDRFYFLCSETDFSLSPLWEKELGRYVRKEYTVWDAGQERIDYYTREIEKKTAEAKESSIMTPSAYLYFLKFHSSKTGGFFGKFIKMLKNLHPEFIIPALLILNVIILTPLFENTVPITGGFVVGYLGLFAETALMLLYQMIYGYLYMFVGLFIALFMGGLSLGAGGRSYHKKGLIASSLALTLACIISAVILQNYPTLKMGLKAGTLIFSFLQFTFGFLSGMLFKECSMMVKGDHAKTAGIMDALDHIGGTLSCILTPLFFVPVIGFTKAMLFFSVVPLLPLIGLIKWKRTH